MMGDNSYSAYTFEGVSANFAQGFVGLYRPHPRETYQPPPGPNFGTESNHQRRIPSGTPSRGQHEWGKFSRDWRLGLDL